MKFKCTCKGLEYSFWKGPCSPLFLWGLTCSSFTYILFDSAFRYLNACVIITRFSSWETYFFPRHTFWWIAYEQWNGLVFLNLGLFNVVVFERRFFRFASCQRICFCDVIVFSFFDEESKDKGERLWLSINVGGRSDHEEDASIFFLDSQHTCICRVGCWLSFELLALPWEP